jgi:hypothetical protein
MTTKELSRSYAFKEGLIKSPTPDAPVPSGAKAPVFIGSLTAGLKPHPFKAGLNQRYFNAFNFATTSPGSTSPPAQLVGATGFDTLLH